MNCNECKYEEKHEYKYEEKQYNYTICKITHIVNTKSCNYISNDKEVENMNICYNCQYWIGCGDYGLSCEKDYYNCNTNGFSNACNKFKRRVE